MVDAAPARSHRARLGVAGAAVVLLSLAGPVSAQAPASQPSVMVEARRLSVRLTSVPLTRALELILERSDAELTLLDDAAGEVTAQFDDVPLEEGLRRLLGLRSYVLVYTPQGAATGPRLKVLPGESRQAAGGPEPREPRTTLRATVSADGDGVRDAALMTAVESGGRGATRGERVRFLEQVLATESDVVVRSAALKMLTAVNPSSLAPIARAARHDPAVAVRRRALELLVSGGQRDHLVMETLLLVAGSDPDAATREQAMTFARNLDPSLP